MKRLLFSILSVALSLAFLTCCSNSPQHREDVVLWNGARIEEYKILNSDIMKGEMSNAKKALLKSKFNNKSLTLKIKFSAISNSINDSEKIILSINFNNILLTDTATVKRQKEDVFEGVKSFELPLFLGKHNFNEIIKFLENIADTSITKIKIENL